DGGEIVGPENGLLGIDHAFTENRYYLCHRGFNAPSGMCVEMYELPTPRSRGVPRVPFSSRRRVATGAHADSGSLGGFGDRVPISGPLSFELCPLTPQRCPRCCAPGVCGSPRSASSY